MTTATLRFSTPISVSRPAKRNLLARWYDAVMEARMRQALREIAMRQHLVPEDIRKDLGSLPLVRGA
jgi:hypothetical protein